MAVTQIKSGIGFGWMFKASNYPDINIDELVNEKRHFILLINDLRILAYVYSDVFYVCCAEGKNLIRNVKILESLLRKQGDIRYIEFITIRKGIRKLTEKIGYKFVGFGTDNFYTYRREL